MSFEELRQSLPSVAALLVGLALVISAVGFVRLVYFMTIGYAFSISAMAAATLALFGAQATWPAILHAALLGVYGLRLGVFQIVRERSPAYRLELEEIEARNKNVGTGVRVGIWISVSLLYMLMYLPGLFNLAAGAHSGAGFALAIAGPFIMLGGILLEAAADHQKSAYKREAPKRFCDIGLYRLVRCPNYLGEILFWVGSFIAGAGAFAHWLHWATAAAGLVCIVLIMVGSTKRLEKKQMERYGADPEFQAYIQSVPVLIPFVPVYSLQKVRVYLE